MHYLISQETLTKTLLYFFHHKMNRWGLQHEHHRIKPAFVDLLVFPSFLDFNFAKK